jgi:hypothetical protein
MARDICGQGSDVWSAGVVMYQVGGIVDRFDRVDCIDRVDLLRVLSWVAGCRSVLPSRPGRRSPAHAPPRMPPTPLPLATPSTAARPARRLAARSSTAASRSSATPTRPPWRCCSGGRRSSSAARGGGRSARCGAGGVRQRLGGASGGCRAARGTRGLPGPSPALGWERAARGARQSSPALETHGRPALETRPDLTPTFPPFLHGERQAAKDCIRCMLHPDPRKRPTASQVRQRAKTDAARGGPAALPRRAARGCQWAAHLHPPRPARQWCWGPGSGEVTPSHGERPAAPPLFQPRKCMRARTQTRARKTNVQKTRPLPNARAQNACAKHTPAPKRARAKRTCKTHARSQTRARKTHVHKTRPRAQNARPRNRRSCSTRGSPRTRRRRRWTRRWCTSCSCSRPSTGADRPPGFGAAPPGSGAASPGFWGCLMGVGSAGCGPRPFLGLQSLGVLSLGCSPQTSFLAGLPIARCAPQTRLCKTRMLARSRRARRLMLGVAARSLSGAEASQLLRQFLALDQVGAGCPAPQPAPSGLAPFAGRFGLSTDRWPCKPLQFQASAARCVPGPRPARPPAAGRLPPATPPPTARRRPPRL